MCWYKKLVGPHKLLKVNTSSCLAGNECKTSESWKSRNGNSLPSWQSNEVNKSSPPQKTKLDKIQKQQFQCSDQRHKLRIFMHENWTLDKSSVSLLAFSPGTACSLLPLTLLARYFSKGRISYENQHLHCSSQGWLTRPNGIYPTHVCMKKGLPNKPGGGYWGAHRRPDKLSIWK